MSASIGAAESISDPKGHPSVPTPDAQLLMVVEGVCAGVVTAFLITGSTVVTVTVAAASVATLAVARHRG